MHIWCMCTCLHVEDEVAMQHASHYCSLSDLVKQGLSLKQELTDWPSW